VLAASVYFRLSPDEWRWIILAIALVWLAEALNTAIERLADAITIEPNETSVTQRMWRLAQFLRRRLFRS